jgi:geranylgeranyl diphosphate synthase type II
MEIEADLVRTRERIETALAAHLPSENEEPATIHRAMRYSVFAGGKRLRPLLVVFSGEMVGGRDETLLPAACAVEMLHTYSLIHDDLPAMDDDDLRRGKPTCHKVFGEALAILAGDALLTRAFEVLAQLPADPARRALAVGILSRAAGTAGMVGGQVYDLAAEGEAPDETRLETIHRMKTASLFSACAEIGAVVCGGTEDLRKRLAAFGEALGLAFQIQDDLLDEVGSEAETGKRVRKDRTRRKMTYPALFGIERSRAQVRAWTEQAERSLEAEPRSERLRGFASWLVGRRS